MSHTDPMILALRALGEHAGTPHDDEHARDCGHCRHELSRLTDLVDLARNGGPVESLEHPPPAVWDRIAAAVAHPAANGASAHGAPIPNGAATPNGSPAASASRTASDSRTANASATANASRTADASATANASAAGTGPATETGPLHGRHSRRGVRPRGRLTTALVGLAAGLIIGIGGTAGIVQLTRAPATRVVAQIELSPLPAFPQWQGSTGTAVMRATGSEQVMVVTLHAPQRTGFYEVWLLARNGVSMISLGDLNARQTGTFTLPPDVDLHNYSRIDISLQPFDGSTLHAKTSVVRGSLPAVALGSGSGPDSAS